jgi:DNA-binding MarR family transcriptional regulator
MVETATKELERRGHPDVRAVHDFTMRAILSGAETSVDVARRMSVSKQAAAKTIIALEERGYVTREADSRDARRRRLTITPLGMDVLNTGEAIFDSIRQAWVSQIGDSNMDNLEQSLRALVGSGADPVEVAGWLSRTSN